MGEIKSLLEIGGVLRVDTVSRSFYITSAFSAGGIAKILQLTEKSLEEPLVICINKRIDVLNLAEEFPEPAYHASGAFWPGALNLILKSKEKTPQILSGGKPYLIFNFPECKEMRELIAAAERPIALCETGCRESQRDELVDRVVKIGGTPFQESTTVSFVDPQNPLLISEGAVSEAALRSIVGPLLRSTLPFVDFWADLPESKPYRTPLFVTEKDSMFFDPSGTSGKVGVLTFGACAKESSQFFLNKTLSASENMCEAAQNFYETLREMDDSGCNSIIIETLPERDLGMKINAKLRKIGMDMNKFALLMNEAD
ncbi:TsaC protein [Chitinispirillum alkaliphilum]|nr:TsaC protein [Chitinispirillum alkaliphilum]